MTKNLIRIPTPKIYSDLMKYLYVLIASISLLFFPGGAAKLHANGIYQLSEADRTLTAIALRLQNHIQLTREQRTSLKTALRTMKEELSSDSLNSLDHRAVLRTLDNRQFRLVVASRYAETIDAEVATLWNELFKANRTKDLDPKRSGIIIRNYYIDLYTVEEIFWNDPISKETERHRIRAYAPLEVKRYHQLLRKKESPRYRYRW